MIEIAKKLQFSLKRKLPMVYQTEYSECGLACLAMLAGFYGYDTDILTLRRQFSISLKGSKLRDLMDIAKKMQLLCRAVKLDLEDLKYLKTPCILHWNLDHFVVLKEVHANSITIHDPATGVSKLKMDEVSKHFTGVAMEVGPASDFTKKKDKTKLRLMDLWHSISGINWPLIQILLLSSSMEVFAIVSPLFIQLVTDHVLVARALSLLYVLSIGFGLLTVVQVATEYVRAWVIVFLGNTLNIQLTANLARHLFKLPLDFFEKRHMGDIVSRFSSIATIQQKISTDFIEGIVDGFMVIVTLLVMLVYSYKLTLIAFMALVLYIALRLLFYPTFKQHNQEFLIVAAKENSIFMESIRAILPLKIFGKETMRENIWQNAYADKLNANIRIDKLILIYRALNHVIFGAENIIIIFLGALAVMNGEFSIGMLLAYISYSTQFTNKAQGMVDKVFEYKMIGLHLERIADIALTEPEKSVNFGVVTSRPIHGEIQVKNLAFKYSEHDPFIFRNLNFTIAPGESVAIVGQSGCGKTTLLKVLLRLLSPTSGDIFIDGVDINKIDTSYYRSQIAAVMQEDTLLSGSIADNICFFDTKPDYDRMHACAMTAAIHDDIVKMPMSYQSLVGDMGTTLSGGQKQRVLLARALYSQPKILFLDEATSHLDVINENIINHHVKNIGITRVIVAHRKETVSTADRVIDLDAMIKEVADKLGIT